MKQANSELSEKLQLALDKTGYEFGPYFKYGIVSFDSYSTCDAFSHTLLWCIESNPPLNLEKKEQ